MQNVFIKIKEKVTSPIDFFIYKHRMFIYTYMYTHTHILMYTSITPVNQLYLLYI